MTARQRAKRWCVALACAVWLLFAIASLLNWARPGMSYDLVPYLGLVAAADVHDDGEVQRAAYRELDRIARPDQKRDLTEHNLYVRQMRADSALFARDIGYYRIKWGYVAPARLLSHWLEPYAALRLIALLSLLIFLGLSALLLWSEGQVQALLLLPPVLMAAEFNYVIASTTPDMMALALVAALLAGWLRRLPLIFIAASAMAVSVRPDLIFIPAGVLAASALFRCERRQALAAFSLSFVILVAARLATSYAGWWQHVSASLYGSDAVVGGAPAFSATAYAAAWLFQLAKMTASSACPYIVLVLVVAYVGAFKSSERDRRHDILFFGTLTGLAGRMVAFPSIEPRLFLPSIYLLTMLAVLRLRPDFSFGAASAAAHAREWLGRTRAGR